MRHGGRPSYGAVVLYVCRHGETADNAARVVQLPDADLSERGRLQADRLARRLAGAGVALVVTSDHRRAHRTAEAVVARTGAPLVVEPLLRERDYGDLRGRPYTEVGELIFAPDFAPPAGETWEVFHRRVDAAWDRIRDVAAGAGGPVAVITHGLVIRSLLRHWDCTGVHVDAPLGNTAVTEVEPTPPYRVVRHGCLAHLDGASAADTEAPSGI